MDLGIKDLRVLVTAGAGGIGLEIARAFVREGACGGTPPVDDGGLWHLTGLRDHKRQYGRQETIT